MSKLCKECTDEDDEDTDDDNDNDIWLILCQKWINYSLFAGLLDSIFTLILDSVLDSNTDKATLCPDIKITQSAGGFYGVILLFCFVGCCGLCIASLCKCFRADIEDNLCCCPGILATLVTIYIPLYITFDNNWPWVCFAMNDGLENICAWVVIRGIFLVINTLLSFIFFVVGIHVSNKLLHLGIQINCFYT